MNFYKRHIGDYLKDTAHLTLLEHGIYSRLLDVYYTREAGIPDAQAARLIGARSKDECESLKVVLGEFFELVDGSWIQARCEREIEEASAQAKANRENGKKGGRPKAKPNPMPNPNETHEKPNGFPVGLDSDSEKNLIQTPDSRLQTPDIGAVVSTVHPAPRSDDFRPKNEAEWLRHFKGKHGFEADPTSVTDRKKLWPVFASWTNAGLTTDFVDAAVAAAQARAREPIACLPLYVDRLMASEQAARANPQLSAKDESRRRAYEVLTGKSGSQPETLEAINGHVKFIG